MKNLGLTIGFLMMTACGNNNSSSMKNEPAISSNTEIARCESRTAEPTEETFYGYDIHVTVNQLRVQALSLNALVQPLFFDIEEAHWSTKPTGELKYSCNKLFPNHDGLDIKVYEDVVVVQRTSLTGLHSPQVFKIAILE